MKLKNYFYALAIFGTLLFVSCNPDSIAEDENPYQIEEGVKKKDIKIPGTNSN